MGVRLTLVADAGHLANRTVALPDGLRMRSASEADAEALAQLHLAAHHPRPGASSLIEARDALRKIFSGDLGALWLEASPVVVNADGAVLAAVLTVAEDPADGQAPACPTVIEVATSFLWRGKGLARALLAEAARVIAAAGRERVTVLVDAERVGALRVFAAAGFEGVTEEDAAGLAEAVGAGVGDWRASLMSRTRRVKRASILGSAEGASGALAVLAVLVVVAAVVGFIALIVGVAVMFLSVMGDPAISPTLSPTP